MRATLKNLVALGLAFGLICVASSCVSSALAAEEPKAGAPIPFASARAASKVVVLGEGRVRQLSWRISAYRNRGGSSKRPCVLEQNLISGGYSQGV
jgi:hypothetical protein